LRLRHWFSCVILATHSLPAQSVTWRIVGDPTGAPAGCNTRIAALAVDSFFAAMRDADSARLAHAVATVHRGEFVFSTGGFTPSDSFVVAHELSALLRYARQRRLRHEHIVVQQVTFNDWRGSGLQFGPIYFTRTADDLGPDAHYGIGKGEYSCRQGISVLNSAPRPSFDPGPRSPARPSRPAPPNER
jgi:hypothetical protein